MKFYVTTPIYYVNAMPHIGHAYTTVAADILSRWNRLLDKEVFFLTGTDEHGAKIAYAAEKEGISPQKFCDKISDGFKNSWKNLKITNDYFIRTTNPEHEKLVKSFLQNLFDKGAVYKGKYEGLYCIHCEKFLTETDLDENGCCPDHKEKPSLHSEENYFFKLSDYNEKLIDILSNEKHPQHIGIFPLTRRNEILGKLKTGLEDISISRAALDWGIPLPFDEKQTAYVWIDALLNYISAIGYKKENSELSKYWPADVHLMAKDILWFHSVIWPAMLLASDMPLPKKVFAHGFFTINGNKMSKTLKNVITPEDLSAKFGTDAARYLLISLFPFGTDGDISWEGLTKKYNTDLANNLGNLVSRTITMCCKYFDGKVPDVDIKDTQELINKIESHIKDIPEHLNSLEFHKVTEKIQDAVNEANGYIEEKAPWKMAKEENPELSKVIFSLLRAIGLISFYLIPFMPEKVKEIWDALANSINEETAKEYFKTQDSKSLFFPIPGNELKKPSGLFPRITD